MSSSETITIDLRKAVTAPIDLQQTLGDDFFAALNQEEILGGKVEVRIKVATVAGNAFRIKVEASGEVMVVCDRCLEELTLPVMVDEQIVLQYSDDTDMQSESYDVVVIPFSTTTYDLSWDVYELIETSLPLQRMHDEGQCNAEILQYIITE